MARTLILLRHAKADWPTGVPDHERPLAPRGVRDAPQTGKWLVATDRVPDLVLCSTAKRTRQTYALVAAGFEAPPKVSYTDEIYGVSAGEMLEAVRGVPEDVKTLMLVSHNPGTQRLALALASDDSDPEMVSRVHSRYPTNTAAVLDVPVPWAELDPGGASIVDVVSPRG